MFSDDLDEQLISSVPAPTAQNIIIIINQLISLDAASSPAHNPFEQHLHDMKNMDLDDNTDFASAADFSDASLVLLFFDPINSVILPCVQAPVTPTNASKP